MRSTLRIYGLMAALAVGSFCLCGCEIDAKGGESPDAEVSEADPTIFKSPADSAVETPPATPIQAKVADEWGGEALNINATVRLPQLDEMPMSREVAANQTTVPRKKMAGPKPVVSILHQSFRCPPYDRFQAWHRSLTPQQRDEFPVSFDTTDRVDDALPCPTFWFNAPDGNGWYIHGWNGPDEFLRQYFSVADQLNFSSSQPKTNPPQPKTCNCGPDCQCCEGCSCGGSHGPYAGRQVTSQSACLGGSCGVQSIRSKGGKKR